MAVGEGKYDAIVTEVREKTQASGVVLIVFSGNQGGGFSVQAPGALLARLPGVLRHMADEIESDIGGVNEQQAES